MRSIVIYHGPPPGTKATCVDGAFAAIAADVALGPDTQFIASAPNGFLEARLEQMIAGQEIPPGSTVYFVDIAPTEENLRMLLDNTSLDTRFVILDHHLTNVEALKGFENSRVTKYLDNSLSGAALAWKHLVRRNVLADQNALPWYIQLISRMDMGQLKGEDDYAMADAVDKLPIGNMDEIRAAFRFLDGVTPADLAEKGRPFLKDQERAFNEAWDSRYPVQITEPKIDKVRYRVFAINYNIRSGRWFDYCLRENSCNSPDQFLVIWSKNPDGTIAISYRSDGTVNVEPISRQISEWFGLSAGGHVPASGGRAKNQSDFERVCRRVEGTDPALVLTA
ncbi:MAG: hypothetical protein M3O22_07170 [Pseudomonadota bacterium]|nr:hypothetical protein [Pseudomonadota bacterium]